MAPAKPVFRPDAIAFNGTKPLNCEPFEIHQVEFGPSRTQPRPVILQDRASSLRPVRSTRSHRPQTSTRQHVHGAKSDGTDDDWAKARVQCQRAAGIRGGFFDYPEIETLPLHVHSPTYHPPEHRQPHAIDIYTARVEALPSPVKFHGRGARHCSTVKEGLPSGNT